VDREARRFSSAAELARHVKKCSDSRGDAFCSREKVWNIVRIAIGAWSVKIKLLESEDGVEVCRSHGRDRRKVPSEFESLNVNLDCRSVL
jgi:hypothetical protein